MNRPNVAAIAAVSGDGGLGLDGRLLFNIPQDLRQFRSKTMGGTLIMGRKTMQSLPNTRPLPGRRNLVITRTPERYRREGFEFHPTPTAALAAALQTPERDVWVIGGGSIYEALLPHCSVIHLTRIARVFPADTFFPDISGWEGVLEGGVMHEGVVAEFWRYERRS